MKQTKAVSLGAVHTHTSNFINKIRNKYKKKIVIKA